MYYSLIKKLLFQLDPEVAHRLTLQVLRYAHHLGFTHAISPVPLMPCSVMGLQFPNPVGLAAGLDKNGDYIDALAALGFGFIEVGTVTPKPQMGNPVPRVFRLPKQQAIINRLGFNNKGVDYLADRLRQTQYKGILGVNIGKNSVTELDDVVEDYLICFRRVAPYASYVTLNISSPNTYALRELQRSVWLSALLCALKREQALFAELHKKYVPLVVKISPDLDHKQLAELADVLLTEKIDGVIATNTMVCRDGVEDEEYSQEMGGISGEPLRMCSTQVVQQLYLRLQEKIPIIACGGILDKKSMVEKFTEGAKLVQLYTGLIYKGPGLVHALLSKT